MGMFGRRARDALRRSAVPHGRLPSWLDGALVLALLMVALHTSGGFHDSGGFGDTSHLDLVSVMLNIAVVLPLLWRRRAPVAVFLLMWCLAAVQALVKAPTFADAGLLVAFYAVASASGRRTTILVGIALEIGIVLALARTVSGGGAWMRAFISLSGLTTAAGALGINVRHRRQIVSGLRERAEQLEQEREHEVALATVTERSRIAREMHDVVAHNLSVMLALCDGAAYHVHDDPERVERALEQASRTGRQALAEMRQLLGILRDQTTGGELAPQPGVHGGELAPQPGVRQIDELVDQVRAAGVPVTYTFDGDLGGAASGVELAIYRIVQEALTNILKHAGPAATVSVNLACAEETVEVTVRDTGLGAPTPGDGGGGLRGMRERAALYDGTLEVGPSTHGGWEVRACLRIPTARPTVAR
jgi:signal transduction histidine kinase